MEILTAKREFKFKDAVYADPNPNFSIDEVMDHYANIYPEWTMAEVMEVNTKGVLTTYRIDVKYKDKG